MINVNVVNNPEEKRFEAELPDGSLALAEYNIAGKNIIFTHTEVPVAYEGEGIGAQLAYTALEYAKSEGFKVQPLCPFIKAYILRHPEYKEISWGF
ncbi:MAG: GNAT family N-acetyltransferase [Chloroflexota bacterium]